MTARPQVDDRALADGSRLRELVVDLYPICRSITGDGVRETLDRIGRVIPLDVVEVPSGTPVLDWTVPREWNIRDAYVLDPSGRKVLDFGQNNLHVVSYSLPVNETMDLASLKERVHTLPDQPDLIPYRTAYWAETWGLCMSHRALEALDDGSYRVVIDSTLEDGALTYGECVIPGRTPDEVLVTCHVCHPSLCNDNLSGVTVATHLAEALLRSAPGRYTYRFLFIPGTIGSITWLAGNRDAADRVRHGFVLAGVGDGGSVTYKRSRRGSAEVDRAFEHVLRHSGAPFQLQDFLPYGYDERQFCSPGFDLAVGCLMRTPWGEYPEYHTSADDLELVRDESLVDTLETAYDVIQALEGNGRFLNLSPHGEPQLGRRGLYDAVGGGIDRQNRILAILWVLNQSDGSQDLLAIAERAGVPFHRIRWAADRLLEAGLLEELNEGRAGA